MTITDSSHNETPLSGQEVWKWVLDYNKRVPAEASYLAACLHITSVVPNPASQQYPKFYWFCLEYTLKRTAQQ
jgi:hypothetical protein